ncbi:hypothetical protein HK096_007201, partial [Nowakowskiella sp. JEL0078]
IGYDETQLDQHIHKHLLSSNLILDLRSTATYAALRLKNSVCIPYSTLKDRMCELPDKHTPLILLTDSLIIDLPTDIITDPSAFLASRGWTVTHTFYSSPSFWVLTAHHKLTTTAALTSTDFARVLYTPLPFLARNITLIEEIVGHNSSTVLDVGCGSGRDLVWLCSRALRGESRVAWSGVGIDCWEGALRRVKSIAEFHGVGEKVLGVRCVIDKDGVVSGDVSVVESAGPYGLVVGVRVLLRAAFGWVRSMVLDGGLLLWFTFVEFGERTARMNDGTVRPGSKEDIVERGELAREFGEDFGFEILYNEIEFLNDGRPMSAFLARKRPIQT